MGRELTRRSFLKASGAAMSAAAIGRIMPPARAYATDELHKLDGMGLAQLVRQRSASPLELVEAAIRRAETVDPKVNSIVTPMFDQAREVAKAPIPTTAPFRGVPTLMKDLVDYAGVRTAFGSRMMMDYVAETTNPLGLAIEKTGMVFIGKSATPEYGLLPTTECAAFGSTNNPWNLAHSPGGSSGGAAAAVAAGIVPIAQGSDGGGSIRIPASCCGLFGLKPSRGRVIREGGPTRPGDLSVRGFLTRSVRDMQVALEAVESPTSGMPGVPARPGAPGRLRIAMHIPSMTGVQPHPEVAKAIQHTASLCSDLGHDVTEAAPPVDGEKFTWAMLTLWSNIPYQLVEAVKARIGQPPPREALEPWTWGLVASLEEQGADKVAEAEAHMRLVTEQYDAFLRDYDMILSPVLASPPPKTGEMAPDVEYDTLYDRVVEYASYTPPANACGLPGMSVPLYWTPEGLPIGSQFVAARGQESNLLALAKRLESWQPWADRWPAIA